MRVKGLTHTPGTDSALVVVETESGTRTLAFFVPLNEANRLARVLGLAGCPCSPIYELLLQLAAGLDVAVERAELDAQADGITACIVLRRAGGELVLPCHPADALALAVRTGAAVVATPRVVARTCPTPERGSDVAGWLARVRPEDFGPVQESAE
jgi:bifunctional DNase/RNase